jgi:hypothetical protein
MRRFRWTPLEPPGLVSIAQRSQRGIGIMGQRLSVNTRPFGRETRELGKASHRGHRGHRGGIGHYGPEALRGYQPFGRETREIGESIAQRSQRGNRHLWARGSQWLTGLWARNTRIGESIAQRSQRPLRGNWQYGPGALSGYRGFGRETREIENIGNQRFRSRSRS